MRRESKPGPPVAFAQARISSVKRTSTSPPQIHGNVPQLMWVGAATIPPALMMRLMPALPSELVALFGLPPVGYQKSTIGPSMLAAAVELIQSRTLRCAVPAGENVTVLLENVGHVPVGVGIVGPAPPPSLPAVPPVPAVPLVPPVPAVP